MYFSFSFAETMPAFVFPRYRKNGHLWGFLFILFSSPLLTYSLEASLAVYAGDHLHWYISEMSPLWKLSKAVIFTFLLLLKIGSPLI